MPVDDAHGGKMGARNCSARGSLLHAGLRTPAPTTDDDDVCPVAVSYGAEVSLLNMSRGGAATVNTMSIYIYVLGGRGRGGIRRGVGKNPDARLFSAKPLIQKICMRRDPRSILGLSHDVTSREEIRAAFRRAARDTHPDKTGATDDPSRFREVMWAYRQLSGDNANEPHPDDRCGASVFGTMPEYMHSIVSNACQRVQSELAEPIVGANIEHTLSLLPSEASLAPKLQKRMWIRHWRRCTRCDACGNLGMWHPCVGCRGLGQRARISLGHDMEKIMRLIEQCYSKSRPPLPQEPCPLCSGQGGQATGPTCPRCHGERGGFVETECMFDMPTSAGQLVFPGYGHEAPLPSSRAGDLVLDVIVSSEQ